MNATPTLLVAVAVLTPLLGCTNRAPNSGAPSVAEAEASPAGATTTPPTRPAGGIVVDSSSGARPTLAPLIEQVRPTVVGVTTRVEVGPSGEMPELLRRFFGPRGRQEQTGIGSGVLIDARGVVLTSYHVVEGASEVRVRTADNEDFTATVKGSDPATDVALLQLRGVKSVLPAARLGSSDALKVGDYVIAIGNPFGLSLTVTSGIVSAKARVIGVGPYDEFLQTDAPINPGNSGGPLFDLAGNVVGINTAITASGQGIGFAVPIDLVKSLLPQLEATGRVVRGFLGVGVQDLTSDLASAFEAPTEKGALVAAVEPNSPGARAGLKEGDIITELNREPIETGADLSRRVALLPPGERVTVHFLRNGAAQEVTATLGERPTPKEELPTPTPPAGEESALGLSLQSVPANLAQALGTAHGAVVVSVTVGSRAERAGLQPGDVIIEANRNTIATPQDFVRIFRSNRNQRLLLRVMREGEARYVVLPAEKG